MDIIALIEGGTASAAYLALAGLVLGGLHGLEPGHSKTMMAAFIIAVQGTVTHAILLGLSAAFSHSIIVWALALMALEFGNELIGETSEPYFMMASGVIVVTIGAVMLFRMRNVAPAPPGMAPDHNHDHGHAHTAVAGHAHGNEHSNGHGHDHGREHGHGHHDATHEHHDDAHARAHAAEIETRFAAGKASVWQTIGFGLTGGLIPCPAAITVLLLCLHIGQFWMGVGMVAAFSAGLALTLVTVGVVAALGLKYARGKFSNINRLYTIAPFISGGLVLIIGVYMGLTGWSHL
jgi:nickel/cobalt transporter (NicO) family protein